MKQQQDPKPLLTLTLDGLANGLEFKAQLGTTVRILVARDLGIDTARPQFLEGRGGLPNARAIQFFELPLSLEDVRAFPGVAHVEGSRATPGNQTALENLVAAAARAGAEMFIGCLTHHPDLALLEKFLGEVTKGRQGTTYGTTRLD